MSSCRAPDISFTWEARVAGFSECGQKHGRQEGDDADDHQEFDEREGVDLLRPLWADLGFRIGATGHIDREAAS
jgi:hypothetical protein